MNRLLIVSNRLPFSVARRKGKLEIQTSAGGLATGLGSIYKKLGSLWIGWPGITPQRAASPEEDQIAKILEKEDCFPIFLPQQRFDSYYYGFCNKTIWPLFHYFTQLTVYNKAYYEAYHEINEIFCNLVAQIAEPGDAIWIQDYHLMLLPELIREKIPSATIGFFLHIPFPSFEVFRLLPWREKILKGLLGADLIGFHTYDYSLHFAESVHRLLGYEHSLGQINFDNRIIKVDTFPMGIDFDRFAGSVDNPDVIKEVKKIRKKTPDRKIILSIDRLDYSKGISKRLEAFDIFLEKYPEYKEKVTLLLVAVPSRSGIEHYIALKKQVDELVGKINGRHGSMGWNPVWYLYRHLPFARITALYQVADVALITPMRDGMNLIAKEFIAVKGEEKGVLVLSEMAGASQEMGEAIIINPNNVEEMAGAIKEALTMPPEEQVKRNRAMQARLRRYDILSWANDFTARLSWIKSHQKKLKMKKLTPELRKKLVEDYRRSERRLLMLDYDGTLAQFSDLPEKAKPDQDLLALLSELAGDTTNKVVIISGRDRATLEKWFGRLDISLVAEHGLLVKSTGENWSITEPFKTDWKESIRPILELYSNRTPGSFVEEKEFALVWHYRKSGSQLARARSNELKDILSRLTSKLNLEVLEGNKVIEIKNVGINKGRAALRWISSQDWDFILAIGDDLTDEEVFSILPQWAYTVKVGFTTSKARFHVGSVGEVRSLLDDLVATTKKPLYHFARFPAAKDLRINVEKKT